MKTLLNAVKVVLCAVTFLVANVTHAASQLYFVHNDHLGTPQVLTDANQKVVWRVESQTPFGVTQVNEDPDGDGQLVGFNLRFPGQYFDKETGLNYNGARYYSTEDGRFIQSDPTGLSDGPNTYAYVGGNPINYFDPDGMNRRRINEPSPSQSLTNLHVNSLIRQVRQIDPAFRYQTVRPAGPTGRYNIRDVQSLQESLQNARDAGFCGPGASLPRPRGVPPNWAVRPSKHGGGKRFVDPQNPHNSARVQPGDPLSPYPNSQNPYVRLNLNGQYRDVKGNPGASRSPDTHIPLENFIFPTGN